MKKLVMKTYVLLLTAMLIAAAAVPSDAGIKYVDVDAPGGGDGTSWVTAYNDLQNALAAAVPGDSVWVAEGTYYPHTSDRSVSFVLASGVTILGGFAGGEMNVSERDWTTNLTILNGDIGAAGDSSDNSYHVVIGSGTDLTAVIDGFTVTAGNADVGDEEDKDAHGGGMYNDGGSPTVANVIFTVNQANMGGGMYNTESSPAVVNVVFSENIADTRGGAMFNDSSSTLMITNALFVDNMVNWISGGGGAIYNRYSDPTLVNVTIVGNSVGPAGTGYGGGIFNLYCAPKLINSILWGNAGSAGYNPQIWNNVSIPEISFSLLEGCGGSGGEWDGTFGIDAGNNLDEEPLFQDEAGGDLRLKAVSPAVNSGNNAAPGLSPTDFDGNPRIAGIAVDMGPYERPCPVAAIVYVDEDATGQNDGSSWGNAFTDLQEALEWAPCSGVTEIWVAEGTYRPTSDDDRFASFHLVSGVSLYGGFAGMETSVTERDSLGGGTILSGDIGTEGYAEDNSYHVVVGSGTNSTAVLNGFMVTLGHADGDGSYDSGGGIYLSEGNPVIANVVLTDNYAYRHGGGAFNDSSSPTIRNAIFSKNSAYIAGGGISNILGSSPTVVNAVFMENSTSYRWGGGGGIHNSGLCTPTFVNVTVFNNDAGTGYGGGMFSWDSTPRLINVVMWGNKAENSYNPQIWNNISVTEISYSLIEGCGGSGTGWDGTYGVDDGGNIDTDPLFLDEAGGDLRLFPHSPAVNAGAVDSIPEGIVTDLGGNPRIVNDYVDIGAYESQATCPPGSILYVDMDATGENAGSSWADAFTKLQYALDWAPVCLGVTQIWVAEGTYTPGTDTVITVRSETFQLLSGVAIYGGFLGGETDLSGRDWEANVTVLSGDIGAPGDSTDNCYHVVTASGTDASALLDGFTITGGNADASVTAPAPALSESYEYEEISRDIKPTLSGSSITGSRIITAWIDTHGGGVKNIGGSPTLRNLVISDNYAADGGGMYNDSGSPALVNVRFIGNTGIWGGAIHNWDDGDPTFVNVFFRDNSADFGAGLYNNWSDPALVNVTMYGNSAYRGGGMYNNLGNPVLVNAILWGDDSQDGGDEIYNASAMPEISYSLIAGSGGSLSWDPSFGSDGGGNVDSDPMFENETTGDLSLLPGSPAMDSGNNGAVGLTATDLEGNERIVNGTIDMGVHEYQGPPCPLDSVLYVDAGAAGAGTGASWVDAFTDLGSAILYTACPGVTEIWVAAGTYYTTSGADRTSTFQLVNGVKIYGGFAGTETYHSERDWDVNVTILSGDIGIVDEDSDNSYHVVTGSSNDSTAMLDGFTVTGGNADGTGNDNCGGGMLTVSGNPTIVNVTFSDNYASNSGSGMYNYDSDPTIVNVIFSGNIVFWRGGGMFNDNGSSPTIVNTVFMENLTSSLSGGGAGIMNSNLATPTLINVTIFNNYAENGRGGGMFNENSTPSLVNTIIWGNSAHLGWDCNFQICNDTAEPHISFSLIEGCGGSGSGWDAAIGLDSGGNIDADPMFMDADLGNLRLYPVSPAIDAGDNGSIPVGISTDLGGSPRIIDGTVDMGAYEFQGTCPPGSVLYVDADAAGLNDGTSWTDAFTELRYALDWGSYCSSVTQIWVAQGLYCPTAGTDRTATFQLVDSLALYGGFAGGETALSARNWAVNMTELSGDIGAAVTVTDNCYHVVTGSGTDTTAVLDGFMIHGGNANGSGSEGSGGGIYNEGGSPRLANLTVTGNHAIDGGGIYNGAYSNPVLTGVLLDGNNSDARGGGMFNYWDSSPVLTSVTFHGNSATTYGGGICNENNCSPTLTNVVFTENMTFINDGGGMANFNGNNLVLTNVVFSSNSSGRDGGGIYNYLSPVTQIINTSFCENLAVRDGGGIYNYFSDAMVISNTILWGNLAGSALREEIYNDDGGFPPPLISYSLILGSDGRWGDPSFGDDMGGNMDGDPLFMGWPLDLRLSLGSPAINTGENSLVPPGVTTDLDGNPRIVDGTVDMGAYEFQPALAVAFPSPIVFEDASINEATCDTIYFANNGGMTCTITGIYGCSTAPFSIDTTMTSHTLAPGSTTGVVVCVYPQTAEPDTAEVTIVSNAWNSPTVVQVRLDGVTPTDTDDRMPQPFRIVSVAPNPFNPSTTVYFTLPEKMPVTATIYSVTGARVRVLASGKRFDPGLNRLTWDGRTDRGFTAASGVYFIRLETRLGTDVTRAVLLR